MKTQVCTVCGHIHDPADTGGAAFEGLPELWRWQDLVRGGRLQIAPAADSVWTASSAVRSARLPGKCVFMVEYAA